MTATKPKHRKPKHRANPKPKTTQLERFEQWACDAGLTDNYNQGKHCEGATK